MDVSVVLVGAPIFVMALLTVYMIKRAIKITNEAKYTYTMKDGVETVETEE